MSAVLRRSMFRLMLNRIFRTVFVWCRRWIQKA